MYFKTKRYIEEAKKGASGVDNPYTDWKEATRACKSLGITSPSKYPGLRTGDPRLPRDPLRFYAEDFPGWDKFLGKSDNLYPSWEEARKSISELGITDSKAYEENRHKDPRLPPDPRCYKDFPGWRKIQKGQWQILL